MRDPIAYISITLYLPFFFFDIFSLLDPRIQTASYSADSESHEFSIYTRVALFSLLASSSFAHSFVAQIV